MKRAAILALLALTACAGKPVQDRPVTVLRPVTVPCALERPAKPGPLPSDWHERDVRQKSALIGKAALDWKSYAEALDAATSGCE